MSESETPAASTNGTVTLATPAEEPLINKRELVELRKETRETQRQNAEILKELRVTNERNARIDAAAAAAATSVTDPAPESKPDAKVDEKSSGDGAEALAVVRKVQRELALERAFNASGLKEGNPMRTLLTDATAGKSADETVEYIKKNAPASATVTTEAAPPLPATGKSDTGSPGRTASTMLPDNPNKIDPATFSALSAKEKIEIVERWKSQTGGRNPYRSADFGRKK